MERPDCIFKSAERNQKIFNLLKTLLLSSSRNEYDQFITECTNTIEQIKKHIKCSKQISERQKLERITNRIEELRKRALERFSTNTIIFCDKIDLCFRNRIATYLCVNHRDLDPLKSLDNCQHVVESKLREEIREGARHSKRTVCAIITKNGYKIFLYQIQFCCAR